MDILRNLFGTLTSGVIRLLVAVGILAAAYFFIVKPVLHTTDNAINSANQSFEKSFGVHGVDITDISGTIDDVNRKVQREIRRSFHTAKKNGNPKRLVRCVQHAAGDVHKIQRCTVKF
jgi:type III secretory pathway component EscR